MALTLAMLFSSVMAQTPPTPAAVASLGLAPEEVSHLNRAIAEHDYVAAEALLLKELEPDAHSVRAGRLLAYLGSVYFLNQDYLHAAIAWKKSEAIAPLASDLQFSLAMAYIQISHPDWARPVLESLAAHDNKSAVYPYWLGRLDYDSHHYEDATRHFEQAIALDPAMARAYDNLGLCYYYRNENEAAIRNFRRAIELDRNAAHPSPWPYLNLGVALQFLGKTQEAEGNLRKALLLDPKLAEAHYRLANILEHEGHLQAALAELKTAIELDGKYAEPHIALAHIYKQLGQKDAADEEVRIYLRLHGNGAVTQPQ
ncbi:MAG: tetratricopeptide repeat protein [Acidobacteriaceae bacterium]